MLLSKHKTKQTYLDEVPQLFVQPPRVLQHQGCPPMDNPEMALFTRLGPKRLSGRLTTNTHCYLRRFARDTTIPGNCVSVVRTFVGQISSLPLAKPQKGKNKPARIT
jgi:hypothetical protein